MTAAALSSPAPSQPSAVVSWGCAVPDWETRFLSGQSLLPSLPLLYSEAAQRAVDFFNVLRIPDVPGMPRMIDAAGDWFRNILRAVAGSLDTSGIRRINDVFLLVPKKNSKTTGGGGLMLTMLAINKRPNALFGLFGPTQEVADIAFRTVVGMIGADQNIKDLFHVQDHLKRVTYLPTDSTLAITTFDPAVATGGKYAGWLLDEAHELSSVSHAARTIEQLRGARTAIHESFGIIISTQSAQPPAGFFKEELDFARKVRNGEITKPGYLPILYEFPDSMQVAEDQPWRNSDLWKLVHPNLGRSTNLEILQNEFNGASQKSELAFRIWCSQHLNIEIGKALHANRWPGSEHWKSSILPGIQSLEALLEICDCCTIGIDGGGLDDLLGLTVVGRERETRRWITWSRAWIDVNEIGKRKIIEAELRRFAGHGDLRIVDIRAAEDVKEVADIVEKIWLSGLLPEKYSIGLDPVGVAAIMDEIVSRGVASEALAPVPQGYKLSGEIKGVARKLVDGSLVHADQPLMEFCVANAAQQVKGNADLITKEVAGKSKIDPLIALFNATTLMARNPEASSGPSIYETEEPLVLDSELMYV